MRREQHGDFAEKGFRKFSQRYLALKATEQELARRHTDVWTTQLCHVP